MIDLNKVIADTQSLIRIDSQNPGIQEANCTNWVSQRLEEIGLTPESFIVDGNRRNLIATIPGEGIAPRLVLLGHLDTVPIGSGWNHPALDGVIVDEKIYGRGACDMKGGVAVALGLFESLLSSGIKPSGDIVFVATVDEEAPDMAGAQALVRDNLIYPDDQVIALEPTGTRLRIAQMGLRWLDIEVTGRMAHAGRAHLGIDSAHIMSRIVDQLKALIQRLPHEDSILGKPRFTCGEFHAGVATNVVPPSANAKFDIRIVPPMKIEEVIPLVEKVASEVIKDFPGAKVQVKGHGAPRPPVRASDESLIVKSLKSSYRKVTGNDIEIGGSDGHEAYTDASMIAALTNSLSCTVFGPGSTDQAHTADEFVSIADLDRVSKVIWDLATNWGNTNRSN
jgi:succinyl-diaminopimelate desuccinylase